MTTPTTGFPYLDEALTRPGSVLAIAHRGGPLGPGSESLENTMSAFRNAVALGYRYLETDVRVTRDGILLAFHDRGLERVTDGRGEIAGLLHAEVGTALIGGHERVPTLAALFDAFPEARFNIDIKDTASIAVLAGFIAARDAWDRVLVGSFSPRRLNAFRRLTRGRVATSAHPLEVVAFRLLPSARLADRLTRGKVAALQVPHRRGRWVVTTPGLVRRAHAVGKHVHVWTIDEPAEMHQLLDRGVDGLMTDRTDILRSVLTERGQWIEHPWRDES